MVDSAPQAIEMGWFDKLRSSFALDKIAQKLNISKHTVLDAALFFGIGFLLGFLWKRYANYFIAFLFFIGVLLILNQLDFLTVSINWLKMQECCGIIPLEENIDVMAMLWAWIKSNAFILFSFIIGFCFGARVS